MKGLEERLENGYSDRDTSIISGTEFRDPTEYFLDKEGGCGVGLIIELVNVGNRGYG